MPSSKRQPHPKMYDTCRTCEYNVSSYGKCKRGFDNFYFRRGKHNGCLQCLQCLNGKAATGNSMQMRAHSECTTVKANKCLRSLKKGCVPAKTVMQQPVFFLNHAAEYEIIEFSFGFQAV